MALVTADVNWVGYGNVTPADVATGGETWATLKLTSGGGTPGPDLADGGIHHASGAAQAVATTTNNKRMLLYYDIGSGNELDFSVSGTEEDQFVYVWGNIATAALTAQTTTGGGGLGIMLGTDNGGTVEWSYWSFFGRDNYGGGWVRMCIDPTKTATQTGSGTSSSGGGVTLSSVRYFGIMAYCDISLKLGFDNAYCDRIDVGTGYYVDGTGGTADAWFADLLSLEGTTSNQWGILQSLNADETSLELLTKLQIGDATGTTATTVTDNNTKIFAANPKYYNTSGTALLALPTSATGVEIIGNATGATSVTFGEAVGSDAGRSGLTLVGNNDYAVSFDWDDGNVNTCNMYGCAFEGLTGTLSWGTNTAHKLFSSTFTECEQFDPVGGIQIRNCSFISLADDGTADASNNSALLWNENIDIQKCNFLANTHSTSDVAHGIEMPSSVGTPYTYTDLLFSGNEVDVHNSSGSAITISKSGTSNPATSTGSVTFSGSVPITIKVVDAANVAITTADVRVEELDGTLVAQGAATAGTYSTSYGGATPLAVRVKIRSSSSGQTRYFPIRSPSSIESSTGLVATYSMVKDEIASV